MASPVTRNSRLSLLRLGLTVSLTVACNPQFADPVLSTSGDDDPCANWTSSPTCEADRAHGCSMQPNPTGCRANEPGCPSQTCQGGDPFIRRAGRSLWLHDKPFRFVGINAWGVAWGLSWAPEECRYDAFATQDEALAQTFDALLAMGVSVARIWAFQSFAGTTGTDYSKLEKVVQYARRAGVRLILVLENMWKDCTQGDQRTDAWFKTGYAERYGLYSLSFPDYVQGLVTHFRDEPVVMAWEIMHEAGANDFAALDGFVVQMSTVIRQRDPNHLIMAGVNDGDSLATSRDGSPSNYASLHAHATIDLVDIHDFNVAGDSLGPSALGAQVIADSLGKPSVLGSLAVQLEDTSPTAFLQRASRISRKVDSAREHGFQGILVYDYVPGWQVPGTAFDARSEEPLAGAGGIIAKEVDGYR